MRLKGKVTVQTFDAESGKLLTEQTSHNILTKAADSLMNGCPYGFDRNTWGKTSFTAETDWKDIYSTIFGGILVFPTVLTENVNTIAPPMDETNYPVGYGSQLGQDTSDSKTLTFNGIDSGEITGGYRFVYDAGTSQANGTWNTLSLTSGKGGYGFIEGDKWIDSYSRRDISSGAKDYVLGLTESHIYVASWNNTIYRFEAHPFNINIAHNDLFGATLENTGITFDGYVYIDYDNDTLVKITGTSTLTIATYDLTDLTASPTTTTLLLGEAISAPSANGNLFVEMDGYYYIPSYKADNTDVYKINSLNGSDITVLTCPTVGNNPRALGRLTNGVHAMNAIITTDDEVITSPFILNASNVAGNRVIHQFGAWLIHSRGDYYFGEYAYYASIFTPYLATIFNLDNPVTKDATKTAKIIYELTEVSES